MNPSLPRLPSQCLTIAFVQTIALLRWIRVPSKLLSEPAVVQTLQYIMRTNRGNQVSTQGCCETAVQLQITNEPDAHSLEFPMVFQILQSVKLCSHVLGSYRSADTGDHENAITRVSMCVLPHRIRASARSARYLGNRRPHYRDSGCLTRVKTC